MLTTARAPGVYYERVDATAPIGTGVRTDIAAFIGIAERGPLDTPVAVESWRQFVAQFGACIGAGYLAYVVRAFFENEGRRCWIVRVASRDAVGGAGSAGAILMSTALPVTPVWRVGASSSGSWGNGLSVRLAETRRAQARGFGVAGNDNVLSVSDTAGFERATLVRISQTGAPTRYRVVSSVDAINRRLIWVNERADQQLAYDEPLHVNAGERVDVESVDYSISVRQSGVPIAVYDSVTLIPEHPMYGPRLLSAAQGGIPAAGDISTNRRTTASAPAPIAIEELRTAFQIDPTQARGRVLVSARDVFDGASLTISGGTDGLSLLRIDDFLGEPFSAADAPEIRAIKCRGVRTLDDVDEVAVVAMPDVHIRAYRVPETAPICVPDPCLQPEQTASPPRSTVQELPPTFSIEDVFRAQAALVDHCEDRRNRIALLDVPFDIALDDRLGVAGVEAWRSRFDTKYAALFYPWLQVVDPLRGATSLLRTIPPTGHVAGQIARTDLAVGVHQSAANVQLTWAEDVSAMVDETTHGFLNERAINVIRPLPGRGLRILGARLASSDPSWRYISIRRLVLMIMKAVNLSTQWAVFEPNDETTRGKVRLSLIVYLTALWARGALAGESAAEAFFVKCDAENNPPELRANGQMVAEIGIAPTTPWEFVVLRVWRTGNELEISESAGSVSRGRS
ncbi:MAG: phage tail sheath C-terminal domain-containing protein [Gemmatimonas sp.]